jgi:hypothetical protein
VPPLPLSDLLNLFEIPEIKGIAEAKVLKLKNLHLEGFSNEEFLSTLSLKSTSPIRIAHNLTLSQMHIDIKDWVVPKIGGNTDL